MASGSGEPGGGGGGASSGGQGALTYGRKAGEGTVLTAPSDWGAGGCGGGVVGGQHVGCCLQALPRTLPCQPTRYIAPPPPASLCCCAARS